MSANNHPKNEVITQQNIQGAYEAIQKKIVTEIWKDESLRAKMLKDPKGTIENLIGHKFDANLNVKVFDTAENAVTFVLPNKKEQTLGDGEFSDLQLDAVAGGFSFGSAFSGISNAVNKVTSGIQTGVKGGLQYGGMGTFIAGSMISQLPGGGAIGGGLTNTGVDMYLKSQE